MPSIDKSLRRERKRKKERWGADAVSERDEKDLNREKIRKARKIKRNLTELLVDKS